MSATLRRRLAQLERQQAPSLRDRIVWWDEGEPAPQAEPGERLIVIRWIWSDKESSAPA